MSTIPPGTPGHGGGTVSSRAQPVRIRDGNFEDGYTGKVEIICPACGDDPNLNYSEVSPAIRALRGPYDTWEQAEERRREHIGAYP